MKGRITNIISFFLLTVFTMKGLESMIPLLSAHFTQKEVLEAMTESTESENSGEQAKASERELIHDEKNEIDFNLWTADLNIIKFQSNYTAWWQNAFLPVFTPPPELA